MALSEGNQGYSVAEGKSRPASTSNQVYPKERVPAIYAKADNVSVDPQFSDFSSIKAGGKGNGPSQPAMGYQHAD